MPEQFLDETWMPAADGPSETGCAQSLTPRERQVLAEIMGGASNKEAGRKLGISPRTVEVHRARIMDKLGAKNVADLVRIALGQGPSASV
jgi:two-component system response regulator FixJ